jgi:hypothetical protein
LDSDAGRERRKIELCSFLLPCPMMFLCSFEFNDSKGVETKAGRSAYHGLITYWKGYFLSLMVENGSEKTN